jgi:glycerophosphoryl diester phosphodiesterase
VSKLALVALALVALAAVAGPPDPSRAAGPILTAAHRGGALLWPENSLLAFGSSVKLGADYLEFDVHLSRDGEVVVIHDPTLERTTTGAGTVRSQTAAELRTVFLKDRAGAVTAERIPLLEEVLRLAATGRRQLLLEIKVDERAQRYPGIEEKVLALLDRHAMSPATVVMAFEAETWRRVRELRPAQRVCALYSGRTLAAMGSTVERELDAAHRAGAGYVGLQHALITPAVVAQAARLGVALGAWTVNDAAAIDRMIGLGVTMITSDRPDLVIKAAAGR